MFSEAFSFRVFNDKILNWLNLKAFAEDKINVVSKIEVCLLKGKKHSGKRRKCWLPAFSLFPTMFSKAFLIRVIRSWACVVKG